MPWPPLPTPPAWLLALAGAVAGAPAAAQSGAPAAAASSPAAAASAPQKVEISGSRHSDVEQRRQATASKIVIGREEIDRFGDSTVGEVLRRLPGVTLPGAPGRGGSPRLRGLGGGYTQLLIDGQRAPRGFSLESLTPEQIERIEILRAPTAETGARAIGGSINIVTREGYKRYVNDLRVGVRHEDGHTRPGLFWTHNDSAGDLIYNVSGSTFVSRRTSPGSTRTTTGAVDDDTLLSDQTETVDGIDDRVGLNVTSRLQWRLGAGGSLMLQPVFFHARGDSRRRYELTQDLGASPAPYAGAASDGDNRFTVGRLNLQARAPLGSGVRAEVNGGASTVRGRTNTLRQEFDDTAAVLRTVRDSSRTAERTLNLTTKVSALLEGDHSLVGGAEVESLRRSERRSTEQDGRDPLAEFEGDVEASSLRLALYAQDEWQLTPNWAAHAGVRWEGIRTRGDAGDGVRPDNRSSVVTPLLHAVWKPEPASRDQVRISLTRSYKTPTLNDLVARPVLSGRVAADAENTATNPDRAGNPALRPELAIGVDLAFERYLAQGGMLSANLFHRRITDYIRRTTEREPVPWSTQQRYVSRPQNLGRALTQGIELEARFRLDQLIDGAPRVELRNNLSLFRSRVEQVPGPDNRLDEQPRATANFGADYRFRAVPLTLGGSVNLTPGYRTRLSEKQLREAGAKRQFDAFALWVFGPAAQVRLLASNLTAADYVSSGSVELGGLRTQAVTTTPTRLSTQLRFEFKL